MKLVITSIVAILFIAVGSFAGVILKPTNEVRAPVESTGAEAEAEEHSETADASYGGDSYGGSSDSGNSDFFKFSREFVVPIMREGQVRSLVIVHITLEIDPSISNQMFSEEPKLRDNIMTTLVGLSNDGQTLARPTEVNNYETIRSMVLMNLKDAISDKIKNVLIVDLAKQDL